MAYIDVKEYDDADGRLKEIYDDLIETRGKLAEVHKIQSLNPETIVAHMDLYLKIMFGRSPLKRYQREMLGVVVSKSNACTYCITHHAEAVNFYWKDDEKLANFIKDHRTISLSETDRNLCDYAKELTLNPQQFKDNTWVDRLKTLGLNDNAILDATLVIGYFNFVNRIVLSLGVGLEEDPGGYNYE
jgi:uncharacterized peroxidase-related enzyme